MARGAPCAKGGRPSPQGTGPQLQPPPPTVASSNVHRGAGAAVWVLYLRSVHAEITCLNPRKLLCATFPPRQVLPCHPKHRHHCRPAPCRPSEEARRRLVLLLLLAARRRRAQRPSSHSGAQRRRAAPPLAREWCPLVGFWRDERFTDFRGSVRRVSAPRASSRVQGRPDGPASPPARGPVQGASCIYGFIYK